MPKLTEQRLNALPHAAVQLSLVGYILPRDQQQLVLLGQHLGKLWPAITQVSQHHATIKGFGQLRSRSAIIKIARRQHRINDAAIDVAQRVQFEAKEPARTTFAKVSAFIAQQPHSAMSNGLADRDGLGVNQVESAVSHKTGRLEQSANERAEAMQASKPLLIRTKPGESRDKIIGNQSVSLFERSNTKKALHQANSDDFRVGEGWCGIVRAAPVSQARVDFEEVINEAVDFSHLVYNGRQMGRPPGVRLSVATPFYTPLELWRPSLLTQYSG